MSKDNKVLTSAIAIDKCNYSVSQTDYLLVINKSLLLDRHIATLPKNFQIAKLFVKDHLSYYQIKIEDLDEKSFVPYIVNFWLKNQFKDCYHFITPLLIDDAEILCYPTGKINIVFASTTTPGGIYTFYEEVKSSFKRLDKKKDIVVPTSMRVSYFPGMLQYAAFYTKIARIEPEVFTHVTSGKYHFGSGMKVSCRQFTYKVKPQRE